MANWKENKVVGIAAAVVALLTVSMTIVAMGKIFKPRPKVEIDTTQSIPGPGKMIK